MNTKLLTALRSFNFYLFLLPVFFVLHGYAEYYNLIPAIKATKFTASYLAGTLIIFLLSRLFFKNSTKAALYSFLIMLIYFFFGTFQDFVTEKFPDNFITRYSFLLPVLLVILIVVFILLKRANQNFERLKLYLNTLMLLLLIFDISSLVIKINKKKSAIAMMDASLPVCKDCPKQDIYLVVAYFYSGNTALKKFFSYNNSRFEDQLIEKGFFVSDSSFSNYNYTIFSIGSLLNMNYLNIPGYYNGKVDLPAGFESIYNNQLINYLQKENYEIHNYSIFDIRNHPMEVKSALLEFQKDLLGTQTLFYRIKRDLGYHLITTFKLKFLERRAQELSLTELKNNKIIDSVTRLVSSQKRLSPKFVYSHLIMPHWPYYFDSIGSRIPESKLMNAQYGNRDTYLDYLKYSNHKILDLVNDIWQKTNGEAIIILLSDHGCRECLETDPNKGNAELLNISAVYFPDKNYTGFYKGMSNVNLFRVVLNSQFNKKLSLIKDSLILLKKE
jgi:hypothetical protein